MRFCRLWPRRSMSRMCGQTRGVPRVPKANQGFDQGLLVMNPELWRLASARAQRERRNKLVLSDPQYNFLSRYVPHEAADEFIYKLRV